MIFHSDKKALIQAARSWDREAKFIIEFLRFSVRVDPLFVVFHIAADMLYGTTASHFSVTMVQGGAPSNNHYGALLLNTTAHNQQCTLHKEDKPYELV